MYRESLGRKKLAVQEEPEGQSGWSVGSRRRDVWVCLHGLRAGCILAGREGEHGASRH